MTSNKNTRYSAKPNISYTNQRVVLNNKTTTNCVYMFCV